MNTIHFAALLRWFQDLDSVEQILGCHSLISETKAMYPTKTRSALLQGAVVLLVAYFEGFVEALFEVAASKLYESLSEDNLRELFNQTSRRLNNPSPDNVVRLFLNLGLPRITYKLEWPRWPNRKIFHYSRWKGAIY